MKYQYWLANIQGLSNRTIRKMLQYAGSAEEIYFLKKEQLQKLGDIRPEQTQAILESKRTWDLEKESEILKEKGIAFVTCESERFPETLRNIVDPPYGLYVKGKFLSAEKRTAAIIGARMCSEYGRAMAEELGKQLALHGVTIISGMARGIDAYGHLGAVKAKGETYAVLGCGVDICYPESNRRLYEQIPQNGGVLSEYPPGQKPEPWHFPARNRIMSALSDVVIIVEAKERSGSLITADFALEQGKDVYAVPGRVGDSLSKGCNYLIKQGAGIISDVEDFLKDLELCDIHKEFQENFNKFLLEKDESLVYSCVDLLPKSIEELIEQTGLTCQKLADILQSLVHKELIRESFKNFYIRVN